MRVVRAQSSDGRVFRQVSGGYHVTRSNSAIAAAASRVVAEAPAPGVSPALARILRPQAAYRWMLPSLAAITPQYIEMVLRSALAGNHVQQWELFDLMFDTWNELSACAQELADGVSCLKMIFEPYAEEDEDPSPEAIERCKLASAALRRMAPDAAADENDLEGTLKDIIDGWFRGVTCLETDWQVVSSASRGQMVAPRATFWVHPVCVAWSQDGRLGLRVDELGQMNPANLGNAAHGQPGVVGAFPPHKFLLGIHKAKSGTALGGALLRPLAWWWCAANFSADWLLNLAQIFGLPFRWANYDPTAPQETVDRICSMLQNMGSAGWAAFPAGTTMELKEAAGKTGDHSPQGELLDRADRYARLLILGQTMSGSQDASKGGGKAFGAVESDVKKKRIEAAGRYACRVFNAQLIPSILTLNYGDADECPQMRLLEDEEGGLEEAQRDQILSRIFPLSKSFMRKKYGQPEPQDEDDEAGGAPEPGERLTSNAQRPTSNGKEPVKALAAIAAIEDDEEFSRELTALVSGAASPTHAGPTLDAARRGSGHFDDALVCSAGQPAEESLLCRAAVQLAPTATGEMMYMPGGSQTITPFGGAEKDADKRLIPITVRVDAAGAAALNAQHAALVASGKRPMFDFNHEDGAASFWPAEYFWREAPEPGIYCRGEWSARGKAAVDGKEYRQFSPVFHVSKKLGATPQNPAVIVCRTHAKPNMGGLVNDPAFHTILPLWAKNAPGAHPDQPNQNEDMTPEELAALQAKNTELQQELDALKARDAEMKARKENTDLVSAEIRAKEAELKVGKAEADLAALQAKNANLEAADKARREADADRAVADAVSRGAIAAKDESAKSKWKALICADATAAVLLASIATAPALGGRITPPNVQIVAEAPAAIMKEYAALVCANAALPLNEENRKAKGRLALKAAALFAKDINDNTAFADMPLDEAIKAADNSNASVGLLSGTLVMQRALPLLQYDFPILSAITQDFSDEVGLYGQTQATRIILKPAVQTRSTAVDSAGRPVGWNTVSPAQMVDVPVTLDEHVGIPTVFGQNILASTVRNLFAEQAPQAVYALGEYAVAKLTALLTSANFNAYAGTSVGTGATTSGSTAITFASNALVYPGQSITGTGIPANTYIASVTSATAAVLTQAATATNTGLTFTLGGGKVPTTYATYVKAVANFDVSSLGDIKAAFDTNEVPQQNRFALLNAAYHAKLSSSSAVNTFYAATQKPDLITDGILPRLQGFTPINAPWFPTSSNRTGFAGHKASLILKSRLPADFTTAVDAMAPGSVTTVTTPGGISVLLVQYVSMREGYAEWRPEVMLGAAVGDRRAGLVITSA